MGLFDITHITDAVESMMEPMMEPFVESTAEMNGKLDLVIAEMRKTNELLADIRATLGGLH